MFKKTHAMAGMLELVDVGPHFRLPRVVVGGGLAAGGATSVQADGRHRRHNRSSRPRQFEEDTTNFLDLLVFIEHMFVTEKVAKSQLAGFGFRFARV